MGEGGGAGNYSPKVSYCSHQKQKISLVSAGFGLASMSTDDAEERHTVVIGTYRPTFPSSSPSPPTFVFTTHPTAPTNPSTSFPKPGMTIELAVVARHLLAAAAAADCDAVAWTIGLMDLNMDDIGVEMLWL
jgi:hypothetical protein